jgi:hypothetical protein
MRKKHTQPQQEIRLSKSYEFLKTEYFQWWFGCVIPIKQMGDEVWCCIVYSIQGKYLTQMCGRHLYNLYLTWCARLNQSPWSKVPW